MATSPKLGFHVARDIARHGSEARRHRQSQVFMSPATLRDMVLSRGDIVKAMSSATLRDVDLSHGDIAKAKFSLHVVRHGA